MKSQSEPAPGLTWNERLQTDETLQAFISAEIARAGIRLDTLEYQNAYLRASVAALSTRLEAAEAKLRSVRRKGPTLVERPHDDAV